MTPSRGSRRALLVAVSVTAALFSSNFLLDVVFAEQQNWTTIISALEVSEGHPRVLLRVTDVLCGVLVLVLLPYVRSALPVGRWRRWATASVVLYAVGGAGAAAVPLPCPDPDQCSAAMDEVQRLGHDGFSILSAGALFVGVVAVALATRREGPRWLHRAALTVFLLGGVGASLASGYFALLAPGGWENGVVQRVQLATVSVWIICLGVYAATDGLDARLRARTPGVTATGR